MYVVALGLAVALVTLPAGTLAAQAAGVVAPPPPRARATPPTRPATVDNSAAVARRDSLALRQRLDIQAWVDSAAGALAGGAPAATTPLPPAAPRADSTTMRPAAPRTRPPTPAPTKPPDDHASTTARAPLRRGR